MEWKTEDCNMEREFTQLTRLRITTAAHIVIHKTAHSKNWKYINNDSSSKHVVSTTLQ